MAGTGHRREGTRSFSRSRALLIDRIKSMTDLAPYLRAFRTGPRGSWFSVPRLGGRLCLLVLGPIARPLERDGIAAAALDEQTPGVVDDDQPEPSQIHQLGEDADLGGAGLIPRDPLDRGHEEAPEPVARGFDPGARLTGPRNEVSDGVATQGRLLIED